MKTPTIKTIQKIQELNDTIAKLYEKKDALTNKLIKKYGVGEWNLDNPGDVEKPYVKLIIKDNLQDFTNGQTMYRMASFRRYDVSVKKMQNKPKEK